MEIEFDEMHLRATNLAAIRGEQAIFSDVSFNVCAGEALIVNGENGPGKSTLLRIIAGLLKPSSGEVELNGGYGELSIGEQCHYIGHLDALKSALSVEENIFFYGSFLAGAEASRAGVLDVLRQVRLDHLRALPAGLLSAGQKRRLSIARLSVAPRPLWLLDEPTVSLDLASRVELEVLAQSHLERGGLIVAATHMPISFSQFTLLDMNEFHP
jgi:heme exporter protein A